MSARDVIVDGRGDDDDAEHEYRPVHVRSRRARRDGEKGHDETDEQEDERGVVDGGAPQAQRPAAWQQRLAAPPFEAHAADGRHVREDQGRVGEADDGVERNGRAEIEGRDEQR